MVAVKELILCAYTALTMDGQITLLGNDRCPQTVIDTLEILGFKVERPDAREIAAKISAITGESFKEIWENYNV